MLCRRVVLTHECLSLNALCGVRTTLIIGTDSNYDNVGNLMKQKKEQEGLCASGSDENKKELIEDPYSTFGATDEMNQDISNTRGEQIRLFDRKRTKNATLDLQQITTSQTNKPP